MSVCTRPESSDSPLEPPEESLSYDQRLQAMDDIYFDDDAYTKGELDLIDDFVDSHLQSFKSAEIEQGWIPISEEPSPMVEYPEHMGGNHYYDVGAMEGVSTMMYLY